MCPKDEKIDSNAGAGEPAGMQLRVLSGEKAGQCFKLEEGSNLIGRWDAEHGAFPEVDLEQYDVDAMVSRKHAVIERQGTQALVQDLGSLNGTFLNRRRILEEEGLQELKSGDELIVGKVVLRLEAVS